MVGFCSWAWSVPLGSSGSGSPLLLPFGAAQDREHFRVHSHRLHISAYHLIERSSASNWHVQSMIRKNQIKRVIERTRKTKD
jgi:hypothetical protein